MVSVTLSLKEGDWNLDLPLRHHSNRSGMARWYAQEAIDVTSFALARPDASSCMSVPSFTSPLELYADALRSVSPRELRVDGQIDHASPAYVDEEYPIHLDITNNDQVPVTVHLDTLLQPTEDGARQSFISLHPLPR